MEPPKVFISYSHDSKNHCNQVLEFSNRLRSDGIDTILDQYEMCPAEGWPLWIDKNIINADFVLMICTETYYRRVMHLDKNGLGVPWEGSLIYQHIYNAGSENLKFIPILFEQGKTNYIPTPLGGTNYYYKQPDEYYEKLYRRLTNQPAIEKPVPGKLKSLEIKAPHSDFFDPSSVTMLIAAALVRDYNAIDQLIKTGINLNSFDSSGLTPLEAAIVKKDIDLIRYLIKNGADVNYKKHNYADTPIFIAVAAKNRDVVVELIRNGADIHYMSPLQKLTPLSVAIAMGLYDMVNAMKEEYSKRTT